MNIFKSLSSEQQQQILKHLELVMKANEKTNLTRIEDKEEAMVLHVEDSLSGIDEIGKAPQGLYGDIGSGAGYPGIPLAIATGRKTVLIDTRQKKMAIVDDIIKSLGMSDQVQTKACRAELLARKQPESFAVLTARAVSQLCVLMELASPLLKRGGYLICYKGNLEDEEITHARRVQKKLGMKIIETREFILGGNYQRTIVTFEKIAKPLIKLPRKEGEAQKNPIT